MVKPFRTFLVIQDPPEVSPLSGRGKVRTPIRTITARPSLAPASHTPCFTGTPVRVTFHVPVGTMGLTTFRTRTTPEELRLRLSAGGSTYARNDLEAPLPGHTPFWSKPLSLFGLFFVTTAQRRFT